MSAYEIWLADGNIGSETVFLLSLIGADGADGAPGTPGVPNPKINFYSEFIGQVSVSASLPDPTIYHFPIGYAVNSYTNSTGVARDYIVHGSYEVPLNGANSINVSNYVDGAIIKTVSAVDGIEWESLGNVNYKNSLFDGVGALDQVKITTSNKVLSVDLSPVEVRVDTVQIPRNVAFFKKVTLNNNESISLKFKTDEAGVPSLLDKAQFFVLEID